MLIYKITITQNKWAKEINNLLYLIGVLTKVLIISDLVAATAGTLSITRVPPGQMCTSLTDGSQQDLFIWTHLMPMMPIDGHWIIDPPEGCTIQYNHLGYKGQLLGHSKQIRTNGYIQAWERSPNILTLKENITCHSMICQTGHAIGQKGQDLYAAPPARQAAALAP